MATEQTPAPIDRKRLRSQRLREVNFQGDALRLGMNWTEEDLRKPQVLVESAYGMGHPGTFHFRGLIEEVSNGVFEAGGKPAEFVVSDICDGVVQATDGMSYARAGSRAPASTTSRRNRPRSGTGARTTRCSAWTTSSSRRTPPITRRSRSAR